MNEEQNNGYVEDLRGKFDKYLQVAAHVEELIRSGQKDTAVVATIGLIELEEEIKSTMADLTVHIADTFKVTMIGGYFVVPESMRLTSMRGTGK